MKKKFLFLILTIFSTLVLLGCSSSSENTNAADLQENQNEIDPVEVMLKNMSITEKIGQMTMIGVNGLDINDDSLFMLHQYHCGGIILFDRNMDTRSQVKQFINNLQKKSEEKVPLFIAIDEEGGRVARMKHEIKPAPSQEEIGSSGELDLAKIWATKTAKEFIITKRLRLYMT